MSQGGTGRWARLEALFDGAFDLPAEERAAWLASACPDDPELRAEVLRMLAAHGATGPLDRQITPAPTAIDPADVARRLDAALAGRYAIADVLGEGATAIVFRAHERKHDREVVLKVLTPQVAAALGTARFLAEIRVTARLSHPNILPLLDSGEADGLLYYVMPHLSGTTLREALDDGPLPVRQAVATLREVADALAHAHAAGVVHRDLKPENVLRAGGHAFLLDFGVAHVEAEARGRTEVVGTVGYMAPEQRWGMLVDPRTDLWAWGRLGVELLTGGRGGVEALAERKDLPKELASLLAQCLAEDSAARPSGAAEVVAALDALPTARGSRREWIVAGAVSAVAVAATIWALRTSAAPQGPVDTPIAVAPFREEGGDSTLTGWGRFAGAWITQGLQQTGVSQVVPWTAVLAAEDRLDAERRAGRPVDALQLFREETGAKTVISGSIFRDDRSLRFTAEISDREGTLRSSIEPIVVPADSGEAGIRELRSRVMGALAIAQDERIAALPGVIDRPPTYEAYRAFDQGLTRFNALDYRTADSLLHLAWSLDTTFVPALVFAVTSEWNAGEYRRADSTLRLIAPRRARLGPYHERRVAAHEAILRSDGAKAYREFSEATALEPSGRAGYSMAWYGFDLGKVAEARRTLLEIDPEHGMMRGWSPYWSLLVHADHALGDHDTELANTRRMRQRFPETRSAWVVEGRALAALGRTMEIDSLASLAMALPGETYWSYGALLVVAGAELEYHRGDRATAARYARQAEAWLRARLAVAPRQTGHRYWLGSLLYDQGRNAEAAEIFAGLVRDETDRLRPRGLWAVAVARQQGEAAGLRILGEPHPWDLGEHMGYRARLAIIAGDTLRAHALLTEAMQHRLDGWSWFHIVARREFPLGTLVATGPAPR
jgi:tRNA A-37 threonylcarbamoyl transferase component Bud32/tetratricopeptide (TPR) repeat protein/TolB-like protein